MNKNSNVYKSLDALLDNLVGSYNSCLVEGFVISRSPWRNERIEVLAFSKYPSLPSVKGVDIKPEFETAMADFLALYEQSEKFKQAISKAQIDFYLQFDYGGGSVTLCKEVGGVFEYNKLI